MTVIYSLDSWIDVEVKSLFDKMKEEQIHHEEKLIKMSGLKMSWQRHWFVVQISFFQKRVYERTDYPCRISFFEDWGRDTMIALPGICISTGRFDSAKSIMRTFAFYEKMD